MYSYRLNQLINNGTIKKVIELPQNPLYLKGETFWCGYWQKYYTVIDANYAPYLSKGKVRMHLNNVTIKWEDGKIATHCTTLDKRDYRIIL